MNTDCEFSDDLYAREPDSEQDGIPVFSKRDAYVENYENIAIDHVSQISATQGNPFMEEELWVSLEASTREYIQRYVPKGFRILDIGVGLGRLLEPLTEYERYGVDISLDYLTIARRRGIEVAFAKIEDLPYKADFFDAIVVCDVLEHVFDLNYCCEKILSCLRPGGVLIVRVPFKEDISVYMNEDLPYEFIHLRNFDEASLRLHFQKIFGLQFLEAAPTTPYLQGTPRLKLRLLPEEARKNLAQFAAGRPEFVPVASAMHLSEEFFQAWIYDLKDKSPPLFKEISDDLIMGIGINAAFIKPYSESNSLRALWAGTIEAPQAKQVSQDQALAGLGKDILKFRQETNEERRKANRTVLSLQQLIDAKLNHAVDAIESLKEHLSNEFLYQKQTIESIKRQVLGMDQTLSALCVPLHEKLLRKFRRIFNFLQ